MRYPKPSYTAAEVVFADNVYRWETGLVIFRTTHDIYRRIS